MNRFLRFTFVIATLSLMGSGFAMAATSSGGTCAAFVGGSCPSNIPAGVTSFYFIDYVNGSDSNNGSSENTPWQHVPGMANASGNAASHQPGPGEGWIFKGGVTVDYHAFPMNMPWGGVSGSPDYFGYDPGWYTGSAWARPIFNGGGSGGYNTASQSLITDNAHHTSYVIMDNVEFTGIYFGSACSNGGPNTCGAVSQYGYSGSDVSWEIKNVYVHGWSHCSFSGACSDPGNEASLLWAKQQQSASTSVHDSVIDGSDSSQDCCNAIASWNEYNNYIAYVDNAEFGEVLYFHDNVITNMVPPSNGVHGNCIHLFGSLNITEYIYNNYVTCLNSGTPDEMFLVEEDSATVYAFNNVMVKDGHGTGFELGQNNGGGGTYVIFQNTTECGSDPTANSSCITGKNGTPTVTGAGNFWITSNSNQNTIDKESGSSWTIGLPIPLFSITCSGAVEANTGGKQVCAPMGSGNGTGNLNIGETYPFAPMDSTAASTVGTSAGNGEFCTTIAAINSAAGSACWSDTTLGVAYNTSNHTVSFPARSPVAHSQSGAWENGAYEANGGGAPAAPTGVSAVVN